jgi:dipeptidyl aminopeptidase/acylaminoacyl peptidase
MGRLIDPAPPAGWLDVERRAGTQASFRQRTMRAPRLRVLALGVAVVLLVVAVATATVVATRESASAPDTLYYNGPLTVNGAAGIVAVGEDGRTRVVWRCPELHDGCGILNGIAWSRDGRWLAYLVPQFNRTNPAAGVHVVDTTTKRERHLSKVDTGCNIPTDPEWSPAGRQLAYACPSRIFLVGRDLAQPHALRLEGLSGGLSSPTWSADGRSLAFAVHHGGLYHGTSSVYLVGRAGGTPRLLAEHATAPAWSPDGRLIAVRASCGGIKLLTPSGRDVTPRRSGCRAIGVPGIPIWSPDGTEIAIQMRPRGGLWVIDRDGRHLRQVAPAGANTGEGAFGGNRPAWRPVQGVNHNPPSTVARNL